MLLMPLTAVVVILTFLILAPKSGPSAITVLSMWSLVYIFIGLYWVLLWRDVVRWTPARIMLTLLSALASLVAGGLVAVFIEHLFASNGGGGGPDWVGILMLSGAGVPVLWLFLTVLVWRETTAERRSAGPSDEVRAGAA